MDACHVPLIMHPIERDLDKFIQRCLRSALDGSHYHFTAVTTCGIALLLLLLLNIDGLDIALHAAYLHHSNILLVTSRD